MYWTADGTANMDYVKTVHESSQIGPIKNCMNYFNLEVLHNSFNNNHTNTDF